MAFLSRILPLVRSGTIRRGESCDPIAFPEHALLIVEERLREQEAEGVRMPEGMPLDELALRILIAAKTGRVPAPTPLDSGASEERYGQPLATSPTSRRQTSVPLPPSTESLPVTPSLALSRSLA